MNEERQQSRVVWILIASTGLLLASALAGGCTAPSARGAAFRSLARSVVEIRAVDGSSGSGFAVGTIESHGRKHVLYATAAHLFDHSPCPTPCKEDFVQILAFGDGNAAATYSGVLLEIAAPAGGDLAVVGELDDVPRPAVRLASAEPEDFEELVTLSNPGTAVRSAATAILSAKGRHRSGEYLLTTTCWHGSSGGLVANLRGEVVGMIVSREAFKGSDGEVVEVDGYCYAEPLPKLRAFLREVVR